MVWSSYLHFSSANAFHLSRLYQLVYCCNLLGLERGNISLGSWDIDYWDYYDGIENLMQWDEIFHWQSLCDLYLFLLCGISNSVAGGRYFWIIVFFFLGLCHRCEQSCESVSCREKSGFRQKFRIVLLNERVVRFVDWIWAYDGKCKYHILILREKRRREEGRKGGTSKKEGQIQK